MPRTPITGTKQPPPDGTLELRYGGDFNGASWEVVQFFLTDATPETPQPELDYLVDTLSGFFAADIVKPFCSNNVHFVSAHGVLVKSDGERWKTRRVQDAYGDQVGPFEAVQVSYLIDWGTLQVMPRAQPRTYIPGVPVERTEDGIHLTSEALDDLNPHVAAYIAHVNSVTTTHIAAVLFSCISFVHNSAYRAFPQAFQVNNGYVNRQLATQRRRNERVA